MPRAPLRLLLPGLALLLSLADRVPLFVPVLLILALAFAEWLMVKVRLVE